MPNEGGFETRPYKRPDRAMPSSRPRFAGAVASDAPPTVPASTVQDDRVADPGLFSGVVAKIRGHEDNVQHLMKLPQCCA